MIVIIHTTQPEVIDVKEITKALEALNYYVMDVRVVELI